MDEGEDGDEERASAGRVAPGRGASRRAASRTLACTVVARRVSVVALEEAYMVAAGSEACSSTESLASADMNYMSCAISGGDRLGGSTAATWALAATRGALDGMQMALSDKSLRNVVDCQLR